MFGNYNKKQMDHYIETVTTEYRKLQDQYIALTEKNKSLTDALAETEKSTNKQKDLYELRIENYKKQIVKAKADSKTNLKTDLISKTLIDAEILAKQIIDRATREAMLIKYAAKKELEEITITRQQVLDELYTIRAKLDTFTNKDTKGVSSHE